MFKARIIDADLLASIRKQPCAVCNRPGPSDPSHIKTRKAGGPDIPINVYPMCRPCHSAWGSEGCVTFINRRRLFRNRLLNDGWSIEMGKLINPQLHLFEPDEEILQAVY